MLRYILRLIILLLKIIMRPHKLGVLETSKIKMRVWPRDIDANLHFNNGSSLTIMDFGRYDYVIRIGLLKLIRKEKWRPLVGSTIIRYRYSLPLFAKFDLHSRVTYWDEKWIYFEQKIIHGGKVATVAHIKGLFIAKGRTIPPSEVISKLGIKAKPPAMPEIIRQWRKMDMSVK